MSSVRRARPSDADAIAELAVELVGEPDPRAVEHALNDSADDWAMFVAEDGGVAIGFAYVRVIPIVLRGGCWARLASMAVRPESRRRGVGRNLLQAAEGFARSLGASSIELTSGIERESAHHFYRAFGYEETSGSRWFARSL